MQIVRARILGMCMGVRRADELAHRAAEKAAQTGRPVYSYGPLIHNPQAVADLESLGVRVLEPSAI